MQEEVEENFYVSGFPTFFVLDASGNLLHAQMGGLKYDNNYSKLYQAIQQTRK